MASTKSALFCILILKFFSDIHMGCCSLREHPLVRNIEKMLDSGVISKECKEALMVLTQRLGDENENIWASKMLDATSKIPLGLTSYTYGDLGHFQQCVEVESKSIKGKIKGKYCLGNIAMNASVAEFYSAQLHTKDLKYLVSKTSGAVNMVTRPTWSMCVPSSCTEKDSKHLMIQSQPYGIGISSVSCQTIEDVYPKLDGDALIGISVLSFLSLIILLSTSYDIYYKNRKKGNSGLTAFSLYTNGKTLFRTSDRSSNLSCLDGIRVLSMIWIIFLHTWTIYTSQSAVFNKKDVSYMTNSIISMVFVNGDLACDTFLLVGGTLLTYVYFKKYKGDNITVFSVFRHYLHRIIRLTPPLAGMVLVSATLLKYMGSGPNWPNIVNYFEGFCKEYWWSTLLYVQNEVNVNKLCVGHTWYLDVDMQLYLFSPFIFWILSKYFKTGMALLTFATISSIVLSFFRAYENELYAIYPHSNLGAPSDVYMNEYYLKTETRAAPWLIGTILGYFLATKKNTEINLPKKMVVPMWILSFAVILLCVFGGFGTLKGPEYYKLPNAFYIALVRPSFVLAVGWIILACSLNHGGLVNSILSLRIFQFLNKFIYSMYLTHVTSLYMINYSSQTPVSISLFNLAYWFWGIFMFMFGISILWVLFFEIPMVNLEKLLLRPIAQKEDSRKQKNEEKV